MTTRDFTKFFKTNRIHTMYTETSEYTYRT